MFSWSIVVASLALFLGTPSHASNDGAAQPPRPDQAEFESALELQIVTKNGGRFTGLVASDGAVAKAIGDAERIAGSDLPADLSIRLQQVNGIQGSMGVKPSEIASLEVLAKLDKSKLDDRAQRVRVAKEKKWEQERERLARVNAERASRAQAEAEAAMAAELAAAQDKKLSPEHQGWIDSYPPSQGWIPALKQQIYHQTIILNNRAPTDQERSWLENYDAWKEAYDAWLAIEQDRRAAEEKAKALGQPAPTGDARSEPTGTAGSAAAGIDPAAPTADDERVLPQKLKPDVKLPAAIDKDVQKPAELKKSAATPVDLKNGTEP